MNQDEQAEHLGIHTHGYPDCAFTPGAAECDCPRYFRCLGLDQCATMNDLTLAIGLVNTLRNKL